MKKAKQGLLKAIATRGVIAAIPVAMASAYASNLFVPVPPRMASYEYQQVAEITVSPNTVGVAASPLYGQTKAQIDQQLSEMQALGVQNIRVFVPWGLVDAFGPSQPGSLSWSLLDTVMQSAKDHGMGVLAEVDSTPPGGVAPGTPNGGNTPDPAKFAAFMSKFVTKYGETVSAYEIWNEPNGILSSNPINPAAYAALVKAAYQAIKPLDPTATVVAGAVGHVVSFGNITMDPVDFVKAMIAADPTIGQYFDALSYHPYDVSLPFSQGNIDPNSGWWASDTAFNQLKDLVKLFPTKKVWITEFGVPTYTYTDANGVVHTITQDQQEKYVADLIKNWAASFGVNAGPIFLYTGRDTATGSTNPEDNYGLWNLLGQPKEVITEFLAQWFKDHPQNGTGPTNPGQPTPVPNPLAAIVQALAKQFQAIAAQVQASVAAFAKAIAKALASIGGAPGVTTSTALALKVASVPTSDTPSAGVDEVSVEGTTSKGSKDSEGTKLSEEPEKSTATDPEKTPAVTDPVVEPADTKTPEAAEPAPSSSTEPSESGPAESGASDTPAKPDKTDTATKPDKTDTATKPDKADKPDKSVKPGKDAKPGKADAKDSSSSKNKGDKKTSSAGAGADKGSDAKGASHSPSGSGSGGGGDEG
ncbi:cellulase family glycosylhydrolase [Mycobacterium hodleri]|uniref:Cellulase family glycosylhydrolase n=1 Tax=Mycolicibacterium hodleri TaxID=49897 RepID=A0A544W8W5_9MYCO|nr:cellulase family glycosylhydrolase [Mycolicibacterium hodleri]TQR88681.1 cellulase family glycosylhydrolase [Mycolicibacterium hodleri]